MEKFRAKKSLGQNFLTDPKILKKIVDAAEVNSTDTLIEVGPGTGNMTEILAARCGRVIAVEKDRRLIESLRLNFNGVNVEVIEDDVLNFNPRSVLRGGYKIVANIPYYITSHFLRVVLEQWPRPEIMVLVVQKEVAQRIMAKPPHMNLLALSVQYYSKPKIIDTIKRGSFRPIPKVDSSILRLDIIQKRPEIDFNLVRLGFRGKRKKLLSVLSKEMGIEKDILIKIFEKAVIDINARAENLSIQDWVKLKQLI